mmetsp:Transcript_39047/g.101753  ORF Transcript_39047/g.101753 Transcript_39047/m.101753 type:complete len:238 (+) Transcript_39047:161-874(+)
MREDPFGGHEAAVRGPPRHEGLEARVRKRIAREPQVRRWRVRIPHQQGEGQDVGRLVAEEAATSRHHHRQALEAEERELLSGQGRRGDRRRQVPRQAGDDREGQRVGQGGQRSGGGGAEEGRGDGRLRGGVRGLRHVLHREDSRRRAPAVQDSHCLQADQREVCGAGLEEGGAILWPAEGGQGRGPKGSAGETGCGPEEGPGQVRGQGRARRGGPQGQGEGEDQGARQGQGEGPRQE